MSILDDGPRELPAKQRREILPSVGYVVAVECLPQSKTMDVELTTWAKECVKQGTVRAHATRQFVVVLRCCARVMFGHFLCIREGARVFRQFLCQLTEMDGVLICAGSRAANKKRHALFR